MKKQKTLNQKHFRHLSKKQFDYPFHTIAAFCTNMTDLVGWQEAIRKIIRVSSTYPDGMKAIDFANVNFYSKILIQHLEILYVLKNTVSDWTINDYSRYYQLKIECGKGIIKDEKMYNGRTLVFSMINEAEMQNMSVFINKLFTFKTLNKWRKVIDSINSTCYSESSLSLYFAYQRDQNKIFSFLEKLGDAIFFIYETKAKEHVALHPRKGIYYA